MSNDLWVDGVKTRRPSARQWVWRATLTCLLIVARPSRAAEPATGLVVQSVAPVSAGALSGFQPGDVLLSWSFRPRDQIEDSFPDRSSRNPLRPVRTLSREGSSRRAADTCRPGRSGPEW